MKAIDLYLTSLSKSQLIYLLKEIDRSYCKPLGSDADFGFSRWEDEDGNYEVGFYNNRSGTNLLDKHDSDSDSREREWEL